MDHHVLEENQTYTFLLVSQSFMNEADHSF